MKWGQERWVKLYTKDTATWRRWRWEGQCVFMQLLRKVDYDGRVDLDGMEPWEVISVLSDGMPEDVCRQGLDALVRTKTLIVHDTHMELVNFRDAQDTPTSNAERQRRYREKRKSQRDTEQQSPGNESLPDVTTTNAEERDETPSNHKRRREEIDEIREDEKRSPSPVGLQGLEDRLQAEDMAILSPGPLKMALERATEVGGVDNLVKVLHFAKANTAGHFSATAFVSSKEFRPVLQAYNAKCANDAGAGRRRL